MPIVRSYPDGNIHVNGVDLRKLGSYSRITALLDQLGFSCQESLGGVVPDTKALSSFIKKLNAEYGITRRPVEEDVSIFSLSEPWLMEFLNKCIRAKHNKGACICD